MAASSTSHSESHDITSKCQFPKRIPHIGINTLEFESGFPEELVEGTLENSFTCSICRGFPRRPAMLDNCGHLFCEPCIKTHFKMREQRGGPFDSVQTAPCPVCMGRFRIGEILTWCAWQKWSQLTYNAKVVKCPFCAIFCSTAFQVDKHQLYECPKRRIVCPVDGCMEEGPADKIENQHFPNCTEKRVYCRKCRLQVRVASRDTHDCVTQLQFALRGIQNN